jgi:hypothetical protein
VVIARPWLTKRLVYLSISPDLQRPAAQEIVRRRVAISHIVIENFSLYGIKFWPRTPQLWRARVQGNSQ